MKMLETFESKHVRVCKVVRVVFVKLVVMMLLKDLKLVFVELVVMMLLKNLNSFYKIVMDKVNKVNRILHRFLKYL